ncbi:MAG: M20/M25/M40 family metallo-hydrolase, partial [Planctomycetes bacterium]|nr:M20/M25/M40 family metallo-hydrolase [Planctomycetota bacterium]
AEDDKGQLFAHLAALEAWIQVAGGSPIRVKFLVEGEEEVGSPNLERVLRDHQTELACDYAVISDSTKFDRDTPAITIAARGFVGKEIIVHGPRQNLHSGEYGGAITNPANALAAIIASFHDDENRVTIPGFYDDVRELEQAERDRLKALPFDETAFLSITGSSQLEGEHGYTTLERLWIRPTLDVSGILSGFTAKGFSSIIPSVAKAKLSMRLVPDQDPQIISRAFDNAARAACPQGVDIKIINHGTCPPYVAPVGSPGVQAAAAVLEAGFGKKPVVVRGGGSLPVLPLIKEVLGADTLMLGFGVPGCNAHGPNEFLVVADFHSGARSAAHLLDRFAKLERTASVV